MIVPDSEPAPFALSAATTPTPHPGLDVLVGGEDVRVAIRRPPTIPDWNALLRLVQELLTA